MFHVAQGAPGWNEARNEKKKNMRCIRFSTSPKGKNGFEGAITFSSIRPSWAPQLQFACDPVKGIIKRRDGNQRPGEMTSEARGQTVWRYGRWIGAD